MSMSSEKFSSITSEFPRERESVSRLGELIGSGKRREMTIDHLTLRVQPSSEVDLVRILERLVYDGTIQRVYRVESPGNLGPIEDFDDFREVPEEIFDPHTGAEISVTPRNVRVMFILT